MGTTSLSFVLALGAILVACTAEQDLGETQGGAGGGGSAVLEPFTAVTAGFDKFPSPLFRPALVSISDIPGVAGSGLAASPESVRVKRGERSTQTARGSARGVVYRSVQRPRAPSSTLFAWRRHGGVAVVGPTTALGE